MANRRGGSEDRTTAMPRTEWKTAPADDRPEVDLLAWLGWIIGGELIIVGLVALARAGFGGFDLFEPVVAVGPFHATRLMALISVALGAVTWAGTAGTADDMGLRVLGAIMLVTGIVWLIEPGGFRQWLGTESVDGVHYAGIGLLLVLFSMVPPFKVGSPPAPPPE